MELSTTDRMRREFDARGWCVADRLDVEELETLRSQVDDLLAEPPPAADGRFHDIERGADRRFLRLRHRERPALAAFLFGPRMRRLASTLIEADPHLFVEQFVVKGPETGAGFGWHQDSGYVGFEHEPYVTFWIALDDITDANGCVYVLERPLRPTPGIAHHVWDEERKERVGYTGPEPGIALECPAGTVIAFSSLTLHRSGPNTTGAPRRAYVCQYSAGPLIDPSTGQPKHFATPLSPA